MLQKKIQYARSRTREDQHVRKSATKIIKFLKMHLMSRNNKKQVLAINTILEILTSKGNEESGRILIAADIPELLCEVMNTHDPDLIERVFNCLLVWSKDEEFYKHKHPAVIIETTCRTIRILSTEDNSNTTIYKGMELLGQILTGCEKDVTVNLNHIFAVASVILRSSHFQGSHLAALSLLKFLLKAEVFDNKELPQLIYVAVTNLVRLRRNNLNRFKKHFKLISQMLSYSMWYFSLHKDNPLYEKAFNVIWKLIFSSVVPYTKELGVSEVGVTIVTRGVNCILNSYKYLDEKRLTFLTSQLAAEGYLTLLPDLNQHFNNKTLNINIRYLLNHILVRLGSSELNLSVSDCKLIGKGLQKLPADSAKWPELLARPQSEDVSLTIIMYLYFVLHCNDSFTKFSTQLPALFQYILYHSSPPSTCILKAITFVFAVLSLSYRQPEEMFNKEQSLATRKLLQWLKSTALSMVFIHHPAMLYWIFSDQVNSFGCRVLQVQTVELWLGNKSTASHKQLEDLALNIKKVTYCLLDLIMVSKELKPEVLSILKSLIVREKSEKSFNTSTYIWYNLPKTLACLTKPGWENRTNNLCCLIFLTCMVVPPHLNVILMLKLTNQLVGILQEKCGKTWEETLKNTKNTDILLLLPQLFKLIYIIINKMNLLKDYRGLEIILEQESLPRACLACIDSDDNRVPHYAIRLLSFLLQCQKQHKIQIKTRGSVMGGEFFMQLMSTGRPHTVYLTAEFFSIIRTKIDYKDFIRLSTDMSIATIYSLYHGFLNLSVRQNMASCLSWKCLSQLLQYCRLYNPETEQALLNHPLNNLALQVAFNKNSIKDTPFVQYLHTYVVGVKLYRLVTRRSYARAICRDPVSTILTTIAEQLVAGDWPVHSLHSQIISTICTVGGDIPLQTINKLKMKMPRQ